MSKAIEYLPSWWCTFHLRPYPWTISYPNSDSVKSWSCSCARRHTRDPLPALATYERQLNGRTSIIPQASVFPLKKWVHEIKFGNHKFTRISGSGSCRRCGGLEGLVKIFILSSWMADDRISWRGKPSALISFGSFREGIILNVFSKGLAYFLL